MCSTQLSCDSIGRNLHLVSRVVRWWRAFLEVRVFGDVRRQLMDLVAHLVAASPAIREYGVASQDCAGTLFVMVTDLIDTGVLHHVSRSQEAIGLIKSRVVLVFWFHRIQIGFLSCSPRAHKRSLKAETRSLSNKHQLCWGNFDSQNGMQGPPQRVGVQLCAWCGDRFCF